MNACDPDDLTGEWFQKMYGTAEPEGFILKLPESELRELRAFVVTQAWAPFDKPEVRDARVKLRQQNEQTIEHVTIDKVISQQFDAAAKEKAEDLIKTFRDYFEQHRAEIETMQTPLQPPLQTTPHRRSLERLEAKLKQEPQFGPDPVEKAY